MINNYGNIMGNTCIILSVPHIFHSKCTRKVFLKYIYNKIQIKILKYWMDLKYYRPKTRIWRYLCLLKLKIPMKAQLCLEDLSTQFDTQHLTGVQIKWHHSPYSWVDVRLSMWKMHALVHIGFRERLGECAIQGGVLIQEDPGTELCVCDLKWAEINLKLHHIEL